MVVHTRCVRHGRFEKEIRNVADLVCPADYRLSHDLMRFINPRREKGAVQRRPKERQPSKWNAKQREARGIRGLER